MQTPRRRKVLKGPSGKKHPFASLDTISGSFRVPFRTICRFEVTICLDHFRSADVAPQSKRRLKLVAPETDPSTLVSSLVVISASLKSRFFANKRFHSQRFTALSVPLSFNLWRSKRIRPSCVEHAWTTSWVKSTTWFCGDKDELEVFATALDKFYLAVTALTFWGGCDVVGYSPPLQLSDWFYTLWKGFGASSW